MIPVLPEARPAVAVIVAMSRSSPRTNPVKSTDATVGAEEDHANGTSGTSAPLASRATAVNCAVSPTPASTGVGAVSSTAVTVATATSTVSARPPAVAETVVAPAAARAVRSPVASTSTTCGSALDQVGSLPLIGAAPLSRSAAAI